MFVCLSITTGHRPKGFSEVFFWGFFLMLDFCSFVLVDFRINKDFESQVGCDPTVLHVSPC